AADGKELIDRIVARFEAGEAISEHLPGGGRINLDRGLPFLIVYRKPAEGRDLGTRRLVAGEAAVLTAPADGAAAALVQRLAEAGSELFGAFLVLEVWAGPPGSEEFVVRGPAGPAPETAAALLRHLPAIPERPQPLPARALATDERSPPGMEPLFSVRESWRREILYLGLEVPPVYREGPDGPLYPRFLRQLQAAFSAALRKAVYEFVRVQTTLELENYRALGVRSVPDAIWEADRELAAIEHTFSLLILTSPVNE